MTVAESGNLYANIQMVDDLEGNAILLEKLLHEGDHGRGVLMIFCTMSTDRNRMALMHC